MKTRTPQTPKTERAPAHVLALLGEMTVQGNLLLQHPRQLDRKDYEDLNRVIEAIGGRWNRHKGAHVFPADVDVAARIASTLAEGQYVAPRANDLFETPEPLAEQVVQIAGVEPDDYVLEPSAGRGRILRALAKRTKKIVGVELLPDNVRLLRSLGLGKVHEGDFLAMSRKDFGLAPTPHDEHGLRKGFDRVVMNPPFSRGMGGVDHVRHAFGMLRIGGLLVSVLDAGVKTRTDKITESFRGFLKDQGGQIHDLPEGSFVASGTNVRTVLVTVLRQEGD